MPFTHGLSLLTCLLAWGVATSTAFASAIPVVIVDTFDPNGETSTLGFVVGFDPTTSGNFAHAEPFSASEDFLLDAIEVGVDGRGASTAFTISLHEDDNGLPGAVIESLAATTDPGGSNVVRVESMTAPEVVADTQYWLSLSKPGQDGFVSWLRNENALSTSAGQRDGQGWELRVDREQATFRITGVRVIPEPSAIALTGLVCLVSRGRTRRR